MKYSLVILSIFSLSFSVLPVKAQDRYEYCVNLAQRQTGYYGEVPRKRRGGLLRGASRGALHGSFWGAIAGDAVEGAAIGAAVGSVASVARQSDDNAYIEDRRAAYEYALDDCLARYEQ